MRRNPTHLILLLLLLIQLGIAVTNTIAQTPASYINTLKHSTTIPEKPYPGRLDSIPDYLGRWGWGWCGGVAVMGDYVLTGSGPSILWVDISDKRQPSIIWDTVAYQNVPAADYDVAREFAIEDSMGYALVGFKLVVLDLRDPRHPQITGELQLFSGMLSLAVEKHIVYAKRYMGPLFCIDASDPTAPFLRSVITSGLEWGSITVSRNNLYMGDINGDYAEYVNTSNLDSMTVTRLYELPPAITAICASDSLLLLNYNGSVQIYSISAPDSPALLSAILLPDDLVTSIWRLGNIAVAGTYHGVIATVDIANPSQPSLMGTFTPGRTDLSSETIVGRDTTIFVSYGIGVTTLNVSHPSNIAELSQVAVGDKSNKLCVRNGLVYLASGRAGLWVGDMQNPSRARRIGNIRLPGYAYDVLVDSSVAYVSINDPTLLENEEQWNGIVAVDISHPDSLRALDSVRFSSACAISMSGSLLFVSHGDLISSQIDTTVTILDVRDPRNLAVAGTIVGGYDALELTSQDSIVFIAARNTGLKIFDCRNPASPELVASIFAHAIGVSVHDTLAYVHRGDSIFVLDISSVSGPSILGETRSSRPAVFLGECETSYSNGRLYWAGGGSCGAYDVSDPVRPTIAFADYRLQDSHGIFVAQDTLYISDRDEGLWIFGIDTTQTSVSICDRIVPIEPKLFPNYPNPFNPSTTIAYDLPKDAHVRLTVYNTLGQEIATLVNEVQRAGHRTITWNGAAIASGVYYYRIQAGDFTATKKLMLVK
jgi:hypothetical protein